MREISIARASLLARLSFYVAGTVVFAVVAVAVLAAWNREPRSSFDASQPMLQLSTPELSRRPSQTRAGQSAFAWYEIMQVGQLYDHDLDFTLAVEMSKESGRTLPRDLRQELGDLTQISAAIFGFPESYYDLETRFGTVRAVRFQIKADGRQKLCMGYLSRFETGTLKLKGWYCEANGSKPSPFGLACLLDRITSKGPLPSQAAQAFFVERMAKGARCAADPVTQTTDTGSRVPLRRLVN